MKLKTKESVKGAKINCPNYDPCPLCYGCRAYDASYYKCITECRNSKRDVCNTHKHNDRALNLMIRPPVVVLK